MEDWLEHLKRLREDSDFDSVVLAWEKERATSVPLFHAHVALRAQVEKVRDDLRRDAVDSDLTGMWAWAVKERAHADALDAALRGGA